MASQDLQYRLKLAEDEQTERLKSVIYTTTTTTNNNNNNKQICIVP